MQQTLNKLVGFFLPILIRQTRAKNVRCSNRFHNSGIKHSNICIKCFSIFFSSEDLNKSYLYENSLSTPYYHQLKDFFILLASLFHNSLKTAYKTCARTPEFFINCKTTYRYVRVRDIISFI